MQGNRMKSFWAAVAAVTLLVGACSGGGPSKRVSIQHRATTSTSTTAELSTLQQARYRAIEFGDLGEAPSSARST